MFNCDLQNHEWPAGHLLIRSFHAETAAERRFWGIKHRAAEARIDKSYGQLNRHILYSDGQSYGRKRF